MHLLKKATFKKRCNNQMRTILKEETDELRCENRSF